jgi:hypothetical protein
MADLRGSREVRACLLANDVHALEARTAGTAWIL